MTALAACGGSDTGGPGGGDDDGTMTPDGDTLPPPTRGFQLQSPEIDIGPGQEMTYCWYFRTPNTETMAIKRWQSHMTSGSHHMIMFTTPDDVKTPGTVTASGCGGAGLTSTWTYASQTEDAELVLPADDGSGKPLGQEVLANQAGYFQMHYVNSTENVLKARVTLNAEAHEANLTYTKTAAYVTYNASIMIPKNAVGDLESQACPVPADTKFWLMSTHAHKQSVKTEVKDGGTSVFMSTEWQHPGVKLFNAPAFFTFGSGFLTYQCTYNNTGTNHDSVIMSGDSAVKDEMCMASGYYFPATKPRFCVNSTLIP